jgi:hypothetical protein
MEIVEDSAGHGFGAEHEGGVKCTLSVLTLLPSAAFAALIYL